MGSVGFFALWYVFQLLVSAFLGRNTAAWLFYNELPPSVSPGLAFSPLSHDFDRLGHLAGNVVMLLGIGGLSEPYLERLKMPGIVIVGGYLGMVVTMATAPLHHFWPLAGASAGTLALWGYAGLSLAAEFDVLTDRTVEGTEEHAVLFLLAGIPIIPMYEILVDGNMAHAIGVMLGAIYFGVEARIR